MLRALPARATGLVLAGLAVIGLGTLAFARYPISAVGLGDRSNAVSSVGTALLWVGIGTLLWERQRIVGAVAAALFVAVLAVGHVQRDVDYARAGRDTTRILAAIRAVQDRRPDLDVVVGPQMPTHKRILGLIGVMDQAVQADSGDLRRRARVASDGADFARTPPARRIDLRRLLSPS
jgi:hypothetical protein